MLTTKQRHPAIRTLRELGARRIARGRRNPRMRGARLGADRADPHARERVFRHRPPGSAAWCLTGGGRHGDRRRARINWRHLPGMHASTLSAQAAHAPGSPRRDRQIIEAQRDPVGLQLCGHGACNAVVTLDLNADARTIGRDQKNGHRQGWLRCRKRVKGGRRNRGRRAGPLRRHQRNWLLAAAETRWRLAQRQRATTQRVADMLAELLTRSSKSLCAHTGGAERLSGVAQYWDASGSCSARWAAA